MARTKTSAPREGADPIASILERMVARIDQTDPPRPGAVLIEIEGLRRVQRQLGPVGRKQEPLLVVRGSLARLKEALQRGGTVYDVLARSGIEFRGDTRFVGALTGPFLEEARALVREEGAAT